MKFLTAVILIVGVVTLLVMGFYFFGLEQPSNLTEVKTISFDFRVVEPSQVGFNLDKDKMHFGSVGRGSSAKRMVDIFNNHTFVQEGEFLILSNQSLGSWFKINPNSTFILNPGVQQTFEIYLVVPNNATFDWYEGAIQVNLRPVAQEE